MSIPNAMTTLDFGLGEELDMLRDSVRGFSHDRVAPIAAEIDRTDEFPRYLWPEMGALGLAAPAWATWRIASPLRKSAARRPRWG